VPFDHQSCAYCGKPECNCRYGLFKAGELLFEVTSTSAQGTLGGMRSTFETMAAGHPDSTRGTWRFSFTEFPDANGDYPVAHGLEESAAASEPESSNVIDWQSRPRRKRPSAQDSK
jgi:hypothetical protein